MLSETLDNTMAKAMKYENLTKASKFTKNRCVKYKNFVEKEDLMLEKISKFAKKSKSQETVNNGMSEIEIIDDKATTLPFFRSIQYKLSEKFCA